MGGGGGGGNNNSQPAEAAPAQPAQQGYAAPQQGYGAPQQQQVSPCENELKQFISCAQTQSDLGLCQGFNVALRECRISYGKLSSPVHDIFFRGPINNDDQAPVQHRLNGLYLAQFRA